MRSHRLQALFHAELLDRPPQQLKRWWAHGRAKHFVYGLGIEAHKLLYPELHRKGAKTDWRLKNRRAEALYIEHRLVVSEAMLPFTLAAETVGLQVTAWHDGDAFHRATGLPRRIDIPWRGESIAVPLHPDAYFALGGDGALRTRARLVPGGRPVSQRRKVRAAVQQALLPAHRRGVWRQRRRHTFLTCARL